MTFSHVRLAQGLSFMLIACADPRSPTVEHAAKGSPDFQAMVQAGIGSQYPAPAIEGQSFGLTGLQGPIVSYQLDPVTGNWVWVNFDTSRQPLLGPETDLVRWGQDFVEKQEADLGIKVDELLSFENSLYHPTEHLTILTFHRHYRELSVKGAFTQLIFARSSEGWRLRELVNNSLGPINLPADGNVPPTSEQAMAMAGMDGLETQSQRSVIQPFLKNGLYEFRYATEFKWIDSSDNEIFTVTFDNNSNQILEAGSSHIRVKNEIQAEHYLKTYLAKDQRFTPMPLVRIQDAANPNSFADTAADGSIDVAFTNGLVVFGGAKSKVGIFNEQVLANETAVYTAPIALAASGKSQLSMAAADPAALNTYMAIHEVVDFVSKYIDVTRLPIVANGIEARINKNDVCNAYYDPNLLTLNFFRQGTAPNSTTTCSNTSLIKDVVYHEWGHALDDFLGVVNRTANPQATGITDGAFSEGIGDILGSMIVGQPEIGKGFFLNRAESIRTVDNKRRHPPANQAEAQVHSAGQIVGGAFWDLRKSLIAANGPRQGGDVYAQLFLKHLMMTDRYLDSYQSVLRLDDTDNNPATRSPNYCKINKAFAAHALTGGTVEGDACIDPDLSLKVRVDVDYGSGQLGLVAAAFGAKTILFCPGKVLNCKVGDAGVVEFLPITQTSSIFLNSERKFYDAPKQAKVTVKQGEAYTLVSIDEVGAVIGNRVLAFGQRDKTTDLSSSALKPNSIR